MWVPILVSQNNNDSESLFLLFSRVKKGGEGVGEHGYDTKPSSCRVLLYSKQQMLLTCHRNIDQINEAERGSLQES